MKLYQLRSILPVLAIAMSTVIANTASAQSDTLRWNLEKGQKFQFEMNQKATQSISMASMDMEMPIEMKMWLTLKVADATNESMQMEVVFDRMSLNLDSPMMSIEFDTNDEENTVEGPAAAMVDSIMEMMGKSFSLTMDPRGNVKKVDIPDDLQGGGMGMGQMMSAENVKDMLSQAFAVLPEDPVKKGDKWNSSIKAKVANSEVEIKSENEYMGVEEVEGRKLHKIQVTSKTTTDEDGDLEILEETQTRNVYFDSGAGYFVSSDGKQEMEMSMFANGQDMEISMKSETNVKVKPKKDD